MEPFGQLNKHQLKEITMLNKKLLSTIGFTVLAISAAACSPTTSTQTNNTPAVVQTAVQNTTVVSSGTFSGRSDHITTGDVRLEKTATGYQLSFAADFSLDGAPDPIVALGNNGTYLKANKIAVLQNKTGRQTYTLPASFTPGQFSQVYVWCEQFDVPLGIADLGSPVTPVSSGEFSGRSDHITTGQVSLEKTNTGYQLRFANDFSLDGAPDPVVAIGNNGVYTKANKLGALKNITGGQVYTLPANFTPGQFSQVYVWCEQFDVPLGIADLSES